jgi:dihydropyrimidinase
VLDLLFRGGLVVLPTGPAHVDVGVAGGLIMAIGGPGELTAERVVEGDDLVVLPGGVDPHVHIRTRVGSWTTLDDFHSGTAAAAFGGTTTIIEFAIPEPDETTTRACERRLEAARETAVVDYSFHACVVNSTFAESITQIDGLARLGIGSVKVFTTYLDTIGLTMEQIGHVLRACAPSDLLVLVHAETDEIIREGVSEQVAAGNLAPSGHALARPPSAEADAIRKIAQLAADAVARIYIVHVSSADGAEAVADLKRSRVAVHAETCTHYLFLDDSVYRRPDGELWICSPPLRSSKDQARLWRALFEGTLDAVSTDHNCFDSKQKRLHRGDFRQIPNGLPGIELRTPALLEAVANGRLSWTGLARLTAEAPARIFGLWPRKGAITIGADADMVLVDPTAETDLGDSHMATDYSPFKGLKSLGRVTQTWLRGECVVADGRLLSSPGSGRFLPTSRSSARD